jgi:predicted nucleic acid-binding protein
LQYLADTSAVVRILRDQVDPAWYELVAARRVAICEPVLREVMKIAGKREYSGLQTRLLDAYEWVATPAVTWDYARSIGDELAKQAMHNMLDVTDYAVAALSIHFKLTVLHEDKDFVAAARVIPQLEQHRITEAFPEE